MEIICKTDKNFKNADAFLFGLKGFTCLEEEITLEELKSFSDKKVFLAIDKNIFNSELVLLEEVLSSIDNYDLSGILFYDLSVLSICKRIKVKTPLIWSQNYLVTNYKTCNYYEKEGVKGALISSVITLDDIVNICNNTKLDILVNGFGYQMMAVSRRKLISNYFEYIGEEYKDGIHYMTEKGNSYPTTENEVGTKMYTNDVLNSIKYINEFKKAGVNYLILDSFMIVNDTFSKVLKLYERAVKEDLSEDELNKMEEEIMKLVPNSSTMFLDKKTVFKVKRK